MPDGFSRAPVEHEDGVFLDMPIDEYVRDRALSGSAFKKLLTDPAGLWWESDQNPLWLRPEKRADRAKLRGSAAHCMILEGAEAYGRRYTVKPEGVLSSEASLKAWLSAKRAELKAASIDGKLSKEDSEAVKQTGERADLIARIHALDPKAPIWDPDDETETLHPTDDQYVRLLDRFVRCDRVFAPLVSDGLPEVSIFWTEGDLRFKARIDYLTAHTILDLKTFGRPPMRGTDIRAHCIRIAGFEAYDLQACHNARALAWLCDRIDQSDDGVEYHASGAGASERIDRLCRVLEECIAQPPVFRWLFLRMGGAPTGIAIPFRESDAQWTQARRQIEDACATYRRFRDKFGDEPWLVTHGEQEINDIMDWPWAASGGGDEIELDEEAA